MRYNYRMTTNDSTILYIDCETDDSGNLEIKEFDLTRLEHPTHKRPLRLGAVKFRTTSIGCDVTTIKEAVIGAIESMKYDVIVAPEYTFFPFLGPMDEERRDKYVEDLKTATVGRDILVAPGSFIWQKDGEMYNSAYVFNNGKVLYDYRKSNNGGDEDIAKRFSLEMKFGESPNSFLWDNLNIGVEICADRGRLYRDRGITELDLMLLLSCGIDTPDTNAIRPGGYAVVCDGSDRCYQAVQHKIEYS